VQFDRFRWYPIKVAAELISDAYAPHAIRRSYSLAHIESIGKSRVPQGGKQRVNGTGEQKNTSFSRVHDARDGTLVGNENARDRPGRLTDQP
jgi:hypothetical protein